MKNRCLKRYAIIPIVPCDEKECDWYINDTAYNNCFWVLSRILHNVPEGLEIKEIAKLISETEEEAQKILDNALVKLRQNMRYHLDEFNF